VELLIRSLPKAERTLVLPVKPAVEDFINAWTGWEPQVELKEALAEFLSERCGREIRAEQFDEGKLPACLRPHVRVRDEKGRVLAFGDDVALIRGRLAGELRKRREESANAEWEMTGGEFWSFGEVPEEAGLSEHLVGEGTATGVYPGLVDEGASVGMRAFLEREEADESHRAGCVRLFLLDQAEQVGYVRKRMPLSPEVRLFLGGSDAGWEDELIRVAAEGAMRDGRADLPRSEEEFVESCKRGKAKLHDAVRELGEAMAEVAAARDRVQEWLEYFRPDHNVESVIADVEEELLWLFRPRWMWRAGFGRLRRYQRHLYAIEERFQRLESQPYVRDEEKQAQVWPLWDRWLRQWQERPDAAWLWEVGWMLAEWRIALFAPSQPREMKVSGKRIERALER
jgi:ATP-dependent helicase HrpA